MDVESLVQRAVEMPAVESDGGGAVMATVAEDVVEALRKSLKETERLRRQNRRLVAKLRTSRWRSSA